MKVCAACGYVAGTLALSSAEIEGRHPPVWCVRLRATADFSDIGKSGHRQAPDQDVKAPMAKLFFGCQKFL